MTIGSGIALAAVWGFAAVCAHSNRVTGVGMWLGVIVAVIATYAIVGSPR